MKKTLLKCGAIGILMLISGCASNKGIVSADKLEGMWSITEIKGESIAGKTENQPFLEFNVKENRVHGNAGCNIINGSFTREEGKNTSLRFSRMMSTMMACPDLDVERRVLESLETVRFVEKEKNDVLVLLDADKTEVLRLEKMTKP